MSENPDIESVLWKCLTWTDWKAIHGSFASGGGGSAKHITLPGSKKHQIADFFDVAGFPDKDQDEDDITQMVYEKDIDLIPVEDVPGSEGPIGIACKYDRRNGEWRITDQDQNRYILWTPDHGFPQPDQYEDKDDYWASERPIIYFAKDSDGNFMARCVYPPTPERLTKTAPPLQSAWSDISKRNNFGITRFTGLNLGDYINGDS